MKKAISFFLALVMCLSLITLTASASLDLFADHPESKTINEGNDVTFGCSIYMPDISSDAKFQWYVNVNDGKGWAPVTGGAPYTSSGTNRWLELENVPASFNGYQFRCWASRTIFNDPVEYTEGWSEIAVLTVIPAQTGVIYGDVTGDGKVTIADLIRLARHLTNIDNITNEDLLQAANTDGIGTVDTADLVRLSRYIAEIDKSPMGPK